MSSRKSRERSVWKGATEEEQAVGKLPFEEALPELGRLMWAVGRCAMVVLRQNPDAPPMDYQGELIAWDDLPTMVQTLFVSSTAGALSDLGSKVEKGHQLMESDGDDIRELEKMMAEAQAAQVEDASVTGAYL